MYMSKKKSYMSTKNILNEGIFEKILDLLKRRKMSKINKLFKDQPGIKSKIKKFNKDAADFEKFLKSQGIDHKIHKIK